MTLMKAHTDSNKIVLNTKSAFRIFTFLSWNGWQHLPPNTGFITSWLSILQSPHLSLSALISFYHLILSLMGFHPQVGVRHMLRCTANKAEGRVSGDAMTTSIYLLSVGIQQTLCFFFSLHARHDHWKWKYLQPCSAWPQVWWPVRKRHGNTWIGAPGSQNYYLSHVLLLSESAICCFVFSLWIRASREHTNGLNSISEFVSLCGTYCILGLTYNSLVSSSTLSVDIFESAHIHIHHKYVGISADLTSVSKTAAHKYTFSHTLHLEKITILRIYR